MSINHQLESSEIIYLNIRNDIEKTKKSNNISTNIKKISKEHLIKEKKIIDFFNQNYTLFYTKFDTNFSKNRIQYPIIVNPNWTKFNNVKLNNVDIKDLIFKTEQEINYTIFNANINCNVTLKGESKSKSVV